MTRHDTRGLTPGLTLSVSSTAASYQVLENILLQIVSTALWSWNADI